MPSPLPRDIEDRLDGLKAAGDQWIARCPTHEDHNPSMTIRNNDGKIVVHCHAGCDPLGILATLGVEPATDASTWTPCGDAVAVYPYRDETGKILFEVCRTVGKQFPQRVPDFTARSGYRWKLGDTRRVLYRLPELIAAIEAGLSVCIAEGEKDVHTLVAQGRVATCNPGGVGGKWLPEYTQVFEGADVTIFADKDQPGQAHARRVAACLVDVANKVWIVEAAEPHKDISAHIAAGLSMSQVITTRKPDQLVTVDLAPTIRELLDTEDPDYAWLIPGLIERGDRVVITGGEGMGKSMWLKMWATCAAAGINPITFGKIDPLKVLLIDCENSLRQTKRALRPMDAQATASGRPITDDLRIVLSPNGVDLVSEDGAAWLLERVIAHKPDLLVIGPLYRLHYDNPNDETTARRVVQALDVARNAVDCAVMLEAHSGHGESAIGKIRSVRPTGSSLYLRWPEFGYGLRPDIDKASDTPTGLMRVVSWRGPRDERPDWPTMLRRSMTGWPWEDASDRSLR